MIQKILDPHLHFFALDEGDYHWLVGESPPAWPNLDSIRQNHTLASLKASCHFNLAGLVHIEAGFDNHQPARELDWLSRNVAPFPYKAIAYAKIDDEPERFKSNIELLSDSHCIGIRDITEGHDATRLSHPNTHQNLRYLANRGLIFEAQGHFANPEYRHLLISLCHAIPTLTVIVTHFALIEQQDSLDLTLQELAEVDKLFIKYSGQEMLSKPIAMHQAFEALLRYFGKDRIMLASNHPVCLQDINYQTLWETYQAQWPDSESFELVSYLNAKRIYRFD